MEGIWEYEVNCSVKRHGSGEQEGVSWTVLVDCSALVKP